MAPFLEVDKMSVNPDVRLVELMRRGLGDVMYNTSAPRVNHFTDQQVTIEQSLTLGGAGLSIISGLLACYWFIRMRASFRHHLIMLLLASDLMKSLFYLIVPIVSLVSGGPVTSNTTLCHAAGFLTAFSIESSDYSILVIAIHAAMNIFIQHAGLSENGLYPYRHVVFTGWVAIPAFMASLAFIDPTPYVSSGTYCYLPVRPFWYRLALSWIPRYAILILIAAIYIAIYLYVRHKFRAFNFSSNDSSYKKATLEQPSVKRESHAFENAEANRSTATTVVAPTTPFMSQGAAADHPLPAGRPRLEPTAPSWEGFNFGSSTPVAHAAENDGSNSSPRAPNWANKNMSESIPQNPPGGFHQGKTAAGDTYNEEKVPGNAAAKISHSVFEADDEDFHPSPHNSGSAPSTSYGNPLKLTDSKDLPMETAGLRARHKAIKRQLRFLFIYPVVYLVMWIVPFVQHCLNYSDSYAMDPSFALSCIVGVLLSLQGLVDSVLFCSRESPWRKSGGATEKKKSGRRSFFPWSRPDSRAPSSASLNAPALPASAAIKQSFSPLRFMKRDNVVGSDAVVGKTKGQSVAEARVARARREAEKMVAREDADKQSYRRKMSLARRGGSDRSWWDVEGQKRKDSVLLGTPLEQTRSLTPKTSLQPVGEPIGEKVDEEDEKDEKNQKDEWDQKDQDQDDEDGEEAAQRHREEADDYYDDEVEIMEAHSEEFITPTDWPLPSRAVPSLSLIPPPVPAMPAMPAMMPVSSVPHVPPMPPIPALVRYAAQPVRDSEESLGPMDERWSTEMRRIPGRLSGEESRPHHLRRS